MKGLMTVSITVADAEPVKTLLSEVALAYPAIVAMGKEIPELDRLGKAVERFRDWTEKPTPVKGPRFLDQVVVK